MEVPVVNGEYCKTAFIGHAINEEVCRGCRRCAKECGSDAITYVNKKAVIDYDKCKGVDAASEPAVLMLYTIRTAVQMNFLTARWQNMHRQSVMVVYIFISHWFRISARTVTAMEKTMQRSFRISECSQALTRLYWIRQRRSGLEPENMN